MKQNLSVLAHNFARERLGENFDGLAIDATAGNGHDTLFLAQLAGTRGRVASFDIQPQAIDATRKKLEENGLCERVDLFLRGHELMAETLGEIWRGRIRAVFFNLGYLPKSDHAIKTSSATTIPALDAALSLLAPDGFISLTVYTRHAGGFQESATVAEWLEKLRSRGNAEIFLCGEHNPVEPWWAGICLRERTDTKPFRLPSTPPKPI